MSTATEQQRPPRDHLYRGHLPGVGLRAVGDGEGAEDDGPVMVGYFAVFNQWTEINSCFEGNFLERFAPGAFKKTIKENRDGMRVLFEHGFDFRVCDKPLGPIDELKEDGEGAYYEVPLLDAAYVRDDVLPGLEAGLFGASFRFRSIREDFNQEPGESDHNPKGLPERTIKEAQVLEFGPVVFPAYEGSSAGLRSLSDKFVLTRFAREPERLRQIVGMLPGDTPELLQARSAAEQPEAVAAESGDEDTVEATTDVDVGAATDGTPGSDTSSTNAPPNEGAAGDGTPNDGRRGTSKPTGSNYLGSNPKEKPSWRL